MEEEIKEARSVLINALNTTGINTLDYLKLYIYYKKGLDVSFKGEFDINFVLNVKDVVFNELQINYIKDKHNNILKYY